MLFTSAQNVKQECTFVRNILGLRSSPATRGETEADSDIDLAAEFDPAARMDLLRLTVLERRIGVLLCSPVDLLPEPVEKRRLQDQIDRDRRRAF
jgi:predicted nucleotidyltransferase